MSAPRRWLETEQADSESLELLRAGQPPLRMDDAVRRRSRRRIAGLTMLPAAAGALASWPQLALGALVGAVSTVAVMSALSPVAPPLAVPSTSANTGQPRPATDRAHLPTPLPATTQVDSSQDAAPAPTTPGGTRRLVGGASTDASQSPQPLPPVDGLQQELQVLEEARRQVSSNPAEAERLLLEHERRFHSGQLRVEREFLLIDALVRLGRQSEAETRARVLEGQAPKSLYRQRLDQILGRPASEKKPSD
jgi:hypothetical protein